MSSPFDAIISDAERREAEADRIREERQAEEARLREERRRDREAEAEKRKLIDFGYSFLRAVVKKVVKADWKPGYLRQIKEYSEALLKKGPSELPTINERHRDKILDIFAYGIQLHHIPDGTFYGQQLLAEREASKPVKPERLRIEMKAVPQHGEPLRQEVVDMDEARERLNPAATKATGPAVTTRTRKGRGRHRSDKQQASAS